MHGVAEVIFFFDHTDRLRLDQQGKSMAMLPGQGAGLEAQYLLPDIDRRLVAVFGNVANTVTFGLRHRASPQFPGPG